MTRNGSILAFCSVLLSFAAPSFAATQVSNLSESYDVSFTANGTHFAHASSFMTDGSSYVLESVTVSVRTNSTGESELRLRADDAGAPGALLESLGTQSITADTVLTFDSTGTPLSPNTRYWVTLGETGSGDFTWKGTLSTAEFSPGSWTIGDDDFHRAAGSTTWTPTSFGPPHEASLFAVDATAPEPLPITWVPVGNPGNACDPQPQGCFGDVAQPYEISKYEVTNAQFAAFLNAIAASDPNGIYNPEMHINRSGSSGSFTYAAVAGRSNQPLTALSFYDTLRFANWLHNGRPTGAQDATTTEDGAYTFSGPTTVGPRNANARIVLATENEWYKAAYYDPASTAYFDWPTSSNTTPTCAAPTATPNRANCEAVVGDFTNVGSYSGSPSPYGTFDQGGNAFEWNETPIALERGIRGGGWVGLPYFTVTSLAAATRYSEDPALEGFLVNAVGFRVVRLAAPVPSLSASGTAAAGSLMLLAGVYALRRRRFRSGEIQSHSARAGGSSLLAGTDV